MEFEINYLMELIIRGFIVGIIFGNVTVLSGWGIKQLIIFFKSIIY